MRVPNTIEEAKSELGGIGSLLQAKEWERAAIVYAFTREGGQRKNLNSEVLTTGEFAALGINGLKSDVTVRLYRNAWKDAGGADIGPGDEFEAPDLDWPPTHRGGANSAGQVSASVSSLTTAIRMAPPEVLSQAVEGAARESLDTASAINRGLSQSQASTRRREPLRRDFNWTPEIKTLEAYAGILWIRAKAPDMHLPEERREKLADTLEALSEEFAAAAAELRGISPERELISDVESYLASVRANFGMEN